MLHTFIEFYFLASYLLKHILASLSRPYVKETMWSSFYTYSIIFHEWQKLEILNKTRFVLEFIQESTLSVYNFF